MTPEQFAYWLQGYAELNETPPTAQQWQSIRDHLALVFNKVTPKRQAEPAIVTPPTSPTSKPIQWEIEPRVTCAPQVARSIC